MNSNSPRIRRAAAAAGSLVAILGLSLAHADTSLTGANCGTTGLTTTGTALGQVIIGCAGAGSFEVNAAVDGNTITTVNADGTGSASLVSGFSTGAPGGSILVNGDGSAGSATLNSLRGIQVGTSSGTGSLTVQNGGLVQITTDNYGLTIGNSSSTGVVTVDGDGSVLSAQGRIYVGSFSSSSGTLTVSNAGVVEAAGTVDNALFIGGDSGTGNVLVTGNGSRLITTGIGIGNGTGTSGGTLTIEDGGTVLAGVLDDGSGSGLSVGSDNPSTITVTGAGSNIQLDAITTGFLAGNEVNIGGFGKGALIIDDGATVDTGGGNVHVSGGVFGTSTGSPGTLTVKNGASLTAEIVTVFANGTLNGNGTISGNVVLNGGTIAPGNSPGTLTITGDYTQQAIGQLIIEIAGNGAGQFDVLNVLGTATFDPGSAISLVFTSGFAPSANQVFDFLLADSFGGDLNQVNISVLGLQDGFQFDAGLTNAGTFTVTALNDGVAAVPAPATLWLLGTGIGLLGWRRRKTA